MIYFTNKIQLSPHYFEVLRYVEHHASKSLRHLLVNCDLSWSSVVDGFLCSKILTGFKNLTFLSMAFSSQMELQQKVQKRDDGQKMITEIVSKLERLRFTQC